jgi:hypothetical protein
MDVILDPGAKTYEPMGWGECGMNRDAPPFDVKPGKVIRMILEATPPMPECFSNTRTWQDWLMLAHTAGERIVRRQDVGKYRGDRSVETVFVDDVDHCIDCHSCHKAEMQKQGRCHPSAQERQRVHATNTLLLVQAWAGTGCNYDKPYQQAEDETSRTASSSRDEPPAITRQWLEPWPHMLALLDGIRGVPVIAWPADRVRAVRGFSGDRVDVDDHPLRYMPPPPPASYS